jgi:glutamate--cysteine ligase catalytic subunit
MYIQGLLVEGDALSPAETAAVAQYVREHGINQFLNTWHRVKDIQNDELKFGDEIECGVLVIDDDNKTVKLSIRSKEVCQF